MNHQSAAHRLRLATGLPPYRVEAGRTPPPPPGSWQCLSTSSHDRYDAEAGPQPGGGTVAMRACPEREVRMPLRRIRSAGSIPVNDA
jgi:hypothetical protein